MSAALKLIGRRFGKWTVLAREGSKVYRSANGKSRCTFSLWRCLCDCGESGLVTSRLLINGNSASCGCLRRQTKFPEGQSFTRLFNGYRSNARRRGIVFELTDRQFAALIAAPCFYTGRAPTALTSYRGAAALTFNGIDRRDPSHGYTVENCVPCCFEVNRAKSDMTESAFMQMIADISNHCGIDSQVAA